MSNRTDEYIECTRKHCDCFAHDGRGCTLLLDDNFKSKECPFYKKKKGTAGNGAPC